MIMKSLIFRIIKKAERTLKKFILSSSAKHISISVSEMFFQHNSQYDFLRYDMIVRLLAVECYFDKNNYGFDFYKRMQLCRKGKEWAEKSVGIFENLIRSFDKNGYEESSEILLDKNLHLIDGSHRMALAMYYNIPTIRAKVTNEQQDVFYSIEWFRVNGFSDGECRILRDKYKELHAKYMQPFVCTLWHPASKYFDEITEKLKLFGEVVDVRDFHFSEWDYKFYTRGIYSVDDIDKWKIEKKIEHMIQKKSDVYNVRMVALELECPEFRLKASNNSTLSKKCEIIKKVIRSYYKEQIDNYFHDIIAHIGDNFYQNRHIYRLFTMPPINVKEMLEHIKDCNYVITKTQNDYMPDDFPVHYPLGKDIDIICTGKIEYNKVRAILLQETEQYKTYYRVRTIGKKDKNGEEYRTLLRLEQEDHLVFQFDIACRTGRAIAQDFIEQLCNYRIRTNGYYIPNQVNEVIIRMGELYNYPLKVQHKKFIENHLADIDADLCDRMLCFDWRKLLYKYNIGRVENIL